MVSSENAVQPVLAIQDVWKWEPLVWLKSDQSEAIHIFPIKKTVSFDLESYDFHENFY